MDTIDEFLQVRYGGIWGPVAGHLGSKIMPAGIIHFSLSEMQQRARSRARPPKLRQMHRWAKCDLKSKFTVAAKSKSPSARPANTFLILLSLLCRFLLFFFLFFFFRLPVTSNVKMSKIVDLNRFALVILFQISLREKNLFPLRFRWKKTGWKKDFYFLPLLFCTNLSRRSLKVAPYGDWI